MNNTSAEKRFEFRKKKKHLIIWEISCLLFVADIILLFLYILKYNNVRMLTVCLSMLVVSVCLYALSMKKITYEEGFTLFQAILLYKKCKKACGTIRPSLFSPDKKETAEVLSKIDFVKKLSPENVSLAYKIGYNYIEKKNID